MNLSRRESERRAFWLGVTMIAGSFLIYPLYAVIAFLPVPLEGRVAAAVVASLLSWTTFFAGGLIAGPRGIKYVKSWLTQSPARLKPPPLPPEEREEED